MTKKRWRCRHCNSDLNKIETLLDDKKELCDKCFVKICSFDKIKMILELDIDGKEMTFEEMIEYLEHFANYTQGVRSYSLEFKKIK